MTSEDRHRFCIMLRHAMVETSDTFAKAHRRARLFAKENPRVVVTIIDRSNGDSHVVAPNPDLA